MWKSEKNETDKGKRGDAVKSARSCVSLSPHPRFSASSLLVVVVVAVAFGAGCRRDMQNQPKMKPYRGTTFFSDGLSGRPPVQGTIPRGFLRTDTEYFTGKKAGAMPGASPSTSPATGQAAGQAGTAGTQSAAANAFPDDVEVFPFPVTEDTVTRGRERYQIFCSVCHGLTGNGDGMVVRRGFRRAASFNDDRLRQAPVGHFFDAMTNGWGAMPSYAAQIPVQDRWAIIAYIRALQLSQQNPNAQPGASPVPGASPAPPPGSAPVQPRTGSTSGAPAVSASPTPRSGGHD